MPNDLTRTTRARNADREATCAVLDSAFADGQLTATEHDELTELAAVAVTLGDLEDLTSDLQTEASLPILRKEPSLDTRWIAVVIIALSLVSAVGFGIKYAASDVTIFSSPEPQLHTVDGLGAMFHAIETEYGSGLVDEMTIYPTYARVTRADPAAQEPGQLLPRRPQGHDFRRITRTRRDTDRRQTARSSHRDRPARRRRNNDVGAKSDHSVRLCR
ncbi:DUF1707 SHOCT-like domain-containing protein [Rhodococcus qingshengii]|uniref:DUF1707 SHOCT-like domain-containing protein n=1 Tax=Rhodococcus qingshengii TaxID=334542 RepID=UPI002034EB0E|nr:DUF1707 domain-containing protein [Rhodococcus qingshengii]